MTDTSSSEHPHLVLTYLDIKGFAEPIRLALSIGEVPFEDRRVSYEEVKSMRSAGELPFGQVPVLDIDGVRHSQSKALLRWAGKHCGLLPPAQELRVDTALDSIADIQSSLVPAWYRHACGRSPVTGGFYAATQLNPEQVEGVFDALNREILPARFLQLENMLAETARDGPFFCGDVLTVADLSAYVIISEMIDGTYLAGLSTEFVRGCVRLTGLVDAVKAHPRVQAWEARTAK